MPDKHYDILIDIRARLGALDQIARHVGNARREAEGFNNAFKLGGVIGITSQLTAQLAQIPSRLVGAVVEGIRFNATLEDARRGVAAVALAFQPDKFASFDDALKDSAKTVDLLKQKAKETSATFQELLEGYQANAGPIFQVGISKSQEQVNLLVAASQAMSALAIPTFQLNQELRGVLAGDTSRISRLNQVLGVTKEELDKATASGNAYQFLMAKLQPFVAAAERGQQSYNVAVSNTKDSLQQLKGIATEELFRAITAAVLDLNKTLSDPETAEGARVLGANIAAAMREARTHIGFVVDGWNLLAKIPLSAPFLLNGIAKLGDSAIGDQARWVEFTNTQTRVLTGFRSQIEAAQTLEQREKARSDLTQHIIGLLERQKTVTGEMKMYIGDAVAEATRLANEFDNVRKTSQAASTAIQSIVEALDKAQAKSLAGRIAGFTALAEDAAAKTALENELELARVRATGDEQLIESEQRRQAVQAKTLDLIKRFGPEVGQQLADEYAGNLKVADSIATKSERRSAETAALREQRDLMRDINDQQNAITSNPFLTTGEKNAQLIPLLLQEAEAHRAAGDAAQAHLAQVQALSLTFSGGIQAGLISWVNSFGTAAQQVSNIITSTLNTAISATSQLITDAIFRTGDWRKAFAQAAQAIVQNLIQIGIQMLVNAALSSIIKKKDTTEATVSGTTIAAGYAPAAAAASIATSGSSAYLGTIAAAVAIAAILALLLGGFESGGYTGGGGTKQVAGVVHGREFVHPAGSVSYYGLSVMEALRQRRIPAEQLHALLGNYSFAVTPRFGGFESGGAVALPTSDLSSLTSGSPGEPKIEFFHYMDPDAMARRIMKSDAGIVGVIDAVNGRFHLIKRNA